MLVEFRVKNYRSFRDEQVLSLVAGKDTSLPENCTTIDDLTLLKCIAVYGPNASGKSNLINALKYMSGIVVNSASIAPGTALPVKPFMLDDKFLDRPSKFEITFFKEGIRYQYGFSATSSRIHDEWLLAFPKRRGRLWFERKYEPRGGKTEWYWGSYLKGASVRLADKTRDDTLFLSVAASWNHEQLSPIYEWFRDDIRHISSGNFLEPVTAQMLYEVKSCGADGDTFRNDIIEILKNADLGISGVNVDEVEPSSVEFPASVTPEVKKALVKIMKQTPPLVVKTLHAIPGSGKKISFSLEDDESDGTKRFFRLIGPWISIFSAGKILSIDELDASLHPLLTRELVRVVQDPRTNKNGAQLIFTTHDTTLLDPALFRRDQIYFTEKDKNDSTRLYSLSDYKEKAVRKGEAMQKGYLAGRYGAIPVLKAFKIK